MVCIFKKIFGKNSDKLSEAIQNGAVLIDVRSQGEFASGNIKNSLNIPLNRISSQLEKLDKNKTIVVFCASGMRSSQAKNILKRNGFSVINGRSWKTVQSVIESKTQQ